MLEKDSIRGQIVALVVFVAICFSAGFIGSFFTAASLSDWYASLNKPLFNPPNWVFAPVWSTLYLLIGISGWLVWRRRGENRVALVLSLFSLQLLLNAFWSVIFFGLREPGWAALEIVLLWAAIALYAVAAWRVSKAASLLMLPYLAWVGFAAVLNFSIWLLNSG